MAGNTRACRTVAWIAALLLALCPGFASASAGWVTHPGAGFDKRPIALQFRREIVLERAVRQRFVHVSADNRFILFVNGHRVAAGPARGDFKRWRYARIDLAPFLRRGKNVVAAQVWNDGKLAGLAQLSARTGFFLEDEAAQSEPLDTGSDWRVRIDASRSVAETATLIVRQIPDSYFASPPSEILDGSRRAWDWAAPTSRSADWVSAAPAVRSGEAAPWTLVADKLPQMAYRAQGPGKLVRVRGLAASAFPAKPLTVPANSEVSLLFDTGVIEAAYPELVVSGGRDARVTVTYAEALYGPNKYHLRDRAQVEGGDMLGFSDTILPDGGERRSFQPYWWRAWRYAEVRVKTGAAPLRLDGFVRHLTGYPFETRARFASSDPQLDRIWRIGWDTVRLDAFETFMDTAFWEQMQYIGDTRIEALATYAVSGDPRLAVQAIEAFDDSKVDGLPNSRWPSSERQSIPPFALLWVGMLHDYWMHQPDQTVLKRSLPAMRSTLDWYARYIGDNGLVRVTPGWEFIDWRPTLRNYPETRNPRDGEPCIITLFYIGALKQAADLDAALDEGTRAAAYRARAARLSQAVRAQCWDAGRGLFADTPEKRAFSQHANVLAVLYDVVPPAEQVGLLDRITSRGQGIEPPAGVTGVTYYFAFYLARALDHAGLADRYLELMPTWRAMLAQNLTTWPENPDPSRSDSHAWSAHPTTDLMAVVAGIQPASPGFASVRIAPHLGTLTRLDVERPHPAGLIRVRYRRAGGKLAATIALPPGLGGTFEWRGQRRTLRGGTNRLTLDEGAASETTQ